MESYKVEILNPKALQLLKGMQDLDLIRVSDAPISVRNYLNKMRVKGEQSPTLEEISEIVKEVRAERNANK